MYVVMYVALCMLHYGSVSTVVDSVTGCTERVQTLLLFQRCPVTAACQPSLKACGGRPCHTRIVRPHTMPQPCVFVLPKCHGGMPDLSCVARSPINWVPLRGRGPCGAQCTCQLRAWGPLLVSGNPQSSLAWLELMPCHRRGLSVEACCVGALCKLP